MTWAAIIELILKILSSILDKNKSADLEKKLKAAAKSYGGTPEGDKGENCRVLLQATHDKLPRVRVYKRAMLRWAIDNVPEAANKAKPALSKAQVSEAKALVEHDED